MLESAASAAAPAQTPPARWRWGLHLLLLTAYPVVIGIVAAMRHAEQETPMLPSQIRPLLAAMSVEMLLFSVVLGLALAVSRPGWEALWLEWKGRLQPLVRGFLYSIALRAMLAVFMIVIAGATTVATGGHNKIVEKLQPETEELVDAKALVDHPAYLALNLTLVSFVFAGFREELWRAGMLAGFNGLLRGGLAQPSGRWFAIGFTAVAFGLGHLPQGWGGVLLTGALGFGLGVIIVRQKSIWEAVLAHGFFNATTFLLLYGMAKFRPDLIPAAH
jgi:membrane protease YdiL (CAAX protease family)